jgi:hypothetical protein
VFRASPPPPVTVEVSETNVTVKVPSNAVPSSEPEPVPMKMYVISAAFAAVADNSIPAVAAADNSFLIPDPPRSIDTPEKTEAYTTTQTQIDRY